MPLREASGAATALTRSDPGSQGIMDRDPCQAESNLSIRPLPESPQNKNSKNPLKPSDTTDPFLPTPFCLSAARERALRPLVNILPKSLPWFAQPDRIGKRHDFQQSC